MGRRLYIDLGSNVGGTVRDFRSKNPDFIIFAFEPNPILAEKLRKDFAGAKSGVHTMECAAWIVDGFLDFYLGKRSDQSSTIITGKKSEDWTVDYTRPTRVQSIDFDRWFRENTSSDDEIVVKMDIEGAEYKLLRRMTDTGSLKRIGDLRVEWHWNRYPDEISKEGHDQIRDAVISLTKLTDWY
jgi:FkbM family methyltransferase